MINIDFINYKAIIRYLILFTIVLVGGSIAKDGFALLVTMIILFFAFMKNMFRTIEIFLIWFFTYNFYVAQDYITVNFISKYITKPSFLLLIVIIVFINRIPLRVINTRYIILWGIFLSHTFTSSIMQGQSPLLIITYSSFFMMYVLLQAKGITPFQYQNLLNLFLASAILQTVVSILQMLELIPPPITTIYDELGFNFQAEVGWGDVASGTMGVQQGHIASWYAAFISLFLMLVWTITKKPIYLFFTVIIFLQFSTVDSKTVLGITFLMLCYMLFFIFKEKKRFKLNIGRYLIFIVILVVGAFGFAKSWDAYYVYNNEQSGVSGADLNSIYKDQGVSSINLVLGNIGEWGKIRGFQYVFDDFIENDPKQLIWGYGPQGFDINSKAGLIVSKDNPIMQINSFTRSSSSLISLFASSGPVGFILFFIAVSQWFKHNNRKAVNNFDLIKISLLKIFVPFTLMVSFLYAIDFFSIPIVIFAAIISIYSKLSDYDRLDYSGFKRD